MAATASKINNFEIVLGAQVDHEDMIIKSVSLMTEGVAEGHNLLIDKTTLEQLKARCEELDNGVKVKINHFSGFEGIVGTLHNFRIKGKKLLGDLHLLKNHSATALVLEMAENMPDTFGLSASFSGVDEELGGLLFARVDEIYSIDLVDRPAANPTGLFEAPDFNKPAHSIKSTTPATNMSEQNQGPTTKELSEQIDKLANSVSALIAAQPKPERQITDDTNLSEVSVGELKDLINGQISEQVKALGWKPGQNKVELDADGNPVAGAPSDAEHKPAEDKQDPKTFEAVVKTLIAEGKSKAEAVSFAIQNPENEELFLEWKKQGGKAHF